MNIPEQSLFTGGDDHFLPKLFQLRASQTQEYITQDWNLNLA